MTREEAIKIVRNIYQTDAEKEALGTLIPELKESEDERIIDDAIQIIRASRLRCAEYGTEADKHLKAIAYLEKQKDLDKMIVVSPEVWDNAIADAYENGKKDGEKQKEPHYTKRNALFDKCVENCDPTVMKKVSDEVDEMLGKEQKPDDDPLDDPKFLKGFDTGREVQRIFDEPKPAEWSEEDEKMLKCCLIAINHYEKTCNIGDHLPTKFNICGYLASVDKVKSWLKSLRPSWKPSEEQMRFLLAVINEPNNAGSESCNLVLKELYEQLKTL